MTDNTSARTRGGQWRLIEHKANRTSDARYLWHDCVLTIAVVAGLVALSCWIVP